jgi:hypothetical protein
MNDRELLELAAKAAGIEGGDGYYWMPTGDAWDPLTDDGDALRLAVKLGATVYTSLVACHIWATDEKQLMAVGVPSGDRFAETRRAIVRAAAEIGKGMK